MLNDQEKYDLLYNAAEKIYKFLDKDRGFYSGVSTDTSGNKVKHYNSYHGSRVQIEKKLNRKLDKYECTVLAIAVGNGPTPALTDDERTDAFTTFWDNKPNLSKGCLSFERLVTCI